MRRSRGLQREQPSSARNPKRRFPASTIRERASCRGAATAVSCRPTRALAAVVEEPAAEPAAPAAAREARPAEVVEQPLSTRAFRMEQRGMRRRPRTAAADADSRRVRRRSPPRPCSRSWGSSGAGEPGRVARNAGQLRRNRAAQGSTLGGSSPVRFDFRAFRRRRRASASAANRPRVCPGFAPETPSTQPVLALVLSGVGPGLGKP